MTAKHELIDDPELLHHYIEPMEGFSPPCPRCQGQAAYIIDVAKDHYAVCPRDKVAWDVGSNLVTTYWRMNDKDLLAVFGTTDRDRLRFSAITLLAAYEVIEPTPVDMPASAIAALQQFQSEGRRANRAAARRSVRGRGEPSEPIS